MKFPIRLLLTLPFLIITFLYYKLHDPDENCYGLGDYMINFLFYLFLFLTGCLALFGTLRKRIFEILSVEPITFSIIVLALLILIFNSTLRGHSKGDKWIYSENKNSHQSLSHQSLALKKNGNFTVELNEADFGCSISGIYNRNGDTIFLDEKAIAKTNENLATTYLMNSNKLIPLFDTTNKTTFYISDIR